jgi:regulatory protein
LRPGANVTTKAGADGALANVTYLPGVRPPEPALSEPTLSAPTASAVREDWSAEERRAENISMHALTRRGLSRWELGEVLLSRELDPCIVEAELDRLEGVGLIDDAALAETIVRTQSERKGLGRAALVAELRRRRIDLDVIEEALEEFDEADEVERATTLAVRRARQLTGLDHETAVRRLGGFLQRKGYSSEAVRGAVSTALPRTSATVRFR